VKADEKIEASRRGQFCLHGFNQSIGTMSPQSVPLAEEEQARLEKLYKNRLANSKPMREVFKLTAYSAAAVTIGTPVSVSVAHKCAPFTEMVHVPGIGRELPYGNYTATPAYRHPHEVYPCGDWTQLAVKATAVAAVSTIAGVAAYNGCKYHKYRRNNREALIKNEPGWREYVRDKNAADLGLPRQLADAYCAQTNSLEEFRLDNNIKEQKQNRSKDDNKSNQVSDKILKKEKRKKKD
jgi:hypothetical protein